MSNIVIIGGQTVRRHFVKMVLSESLCPVSYVFHSVEKIPKTQKWEHSSSAVFTCDQNSHTDLINSVPEISKVTGFSVRISRPK